MEQTLKSRFCLARGTTEYWNSRPDFIPLLGEAVIYLDYKSETDESGNVVNYPGVKYGDGKTLLSDLKFAEDYPLLMLQRHIDESKTYIYVQSEPAISWTIVHNLDNYPTVTIVTNDGKVVEGDITYVNRNMIKLDFTSPFTGAAYLN